MSFLKHYGAGENYIRQKELELYLTGNDSARHLLRQQRNVFKLISLFCSFVATALRKARQLVAQQHETEDINSSVDWDFNSHKQGPFIHHNTRY